jgi:hypothetical protein
MNSLAPTTPSSLSVLLLAGFAGACWLVALAALSFAAILYPDRHDAHGVVDIAVTAMAVLAVVAAIVAWILSAAASSRLRCLLLAGGLPPNKSLERTRGE